MGLPVDEESIKVRRRRFLHLLSSASAKFDQAATESTKQFAEGAMLELFFPSGFDFTNRRRQEHSF